MREVGAAPRTALLAFLLSQPATANRQHLIRQRRAARAPEDDRAGHPYPALDEIRHRDRDEE